MLGPKRMCVAWGWVGFDISNGPIARMRYVRVATGAGLYRSRGLYLGELCGRIGRIG